MKGKIRFYVEKNSWLVQASVILMVLSLAFRLAGSVGRWWDELYAVTQILLPALCNVLFVLCLLLLGKRFFAATAVPVLLGLVFFMIRIFDMQLGTLHSVLCLLLYIAVGVLYTATVFGRIRTKWLLVPLFALPFIYHVAVEDAAVIRAGEMSFAYCMQELSVLCIMLSLFFSSLAMKKKPTRPAIEDMELPKMDAPKVIVPGAAGEAQPGAEAGENAAKACAEADNAPCTEAAPERNNDIGEN